MNRDTQESQYDRDFELQCHRADDLYKQHKLRQIEQASEVMAQSILKQLIGRIRKEQDKLDALDAESHLWYCRMEEMITDELSSAAANLHLFQTLVR